jgi:hypothetical protein
MKKLIVFLALILITTVSFGQYSKKVSYYDNGSKKEVLRYYENKLSGTCIAWNADGVIVAKVQYNDGIKDGKWFMWHNNGTPAYEFYYKDNIKVGVWKFYDESGKLSGSKQYDPKYNKNTLITLGTFTLSDVSITIVQRLNGNKPYVLGGEYATYVSDGEYGDFTKFEKFSKHSILGVGGLATDNWAILMKAGTYFGDDHDEYLNEFNYTKIDYGLEVLLFADDEETNITPIVGFNVSKGMRIQMKFGITF